MLFTKVLVLMTNFGIAVVNSFWLLASIKPPSTGAVEMGTAAQIAARTIFEAFKGNWQELADGRSPIFTATVRVSLIFATILIALWAIPWLNTILEEGYSQKTVDQLIYPILVVFMLSINSGSLLASSCLLGRNTINYVDNQVLQVTINNIKIEEAIRQANMNQALKQMLGGKVDQCRLLPSSDKNQDGIDSQSACIQRAISEVKQIAENYNSQTGALGWNFNLNLDLDIGKILAEAVNTQIQRDIFVLFTTFQAGFVFLVEISLLLNAYIAPVFLSLSLLPGQSKLIHAWLSGWLGLGLVKVSYTVIIGIAASAVVTSKDTTPLLLPLLQAVLSPVLAVIIASGGGITLFTGLTSLAGGGLRLMMRSGGLRRRS
jgi:hypothetical protein